MLKEKVPPKDTNSLDYEVFKNLFQEGKRQGLAAQKALKERKREEGGKGRVGITL